MSDYKPPLKHINFVLRDVINVQALPAASELDDEMLEGILTEAGRLAADEMAPLNYPGNEEGCTLENGTVKTPKGWKEAYSHYVDGGWNGVSSTSKYGGMELPFAVSFGVAEMWQSANMAFALCPMLNQAAIEAMEIYGSQEQKDLYLEKMISGEWTGTMNLTEPQAGSDLSVIKTKAEPQNDGSYKMTGQKIFITYGDHDMTDNIVHMVLARTPNAPEGTKGISLFLMPKYLLDDQGNPAAKNDVECSKLEEKMGIHGSPTCVMHYGDNGGAKAWLIGKENEGLKYMFIMMNNARLAVGLQGVGLAERAYQHAYQYALTRVQGGKIGDKTGGRVALIEHPDVRRMLLSMKSRVEAGRALAYEAALMLDNAKSDDAAAKQSGQDAVDILTPIVKAWCTDMAVDVTSIGVQVHGGMGFIEETGAAQYYRDARILPIYEGTNGIQAHDLAFRKIVMNGGKAANEWLDKADQYIQAAQSNSDLKPMADYLDKKITDLRQSVNDIAQTGATDPESVAAICVPFANAFGTTAGGIMMLRAALAATDQVAAGNDVDFYQGRVDSAAFYMQHILPSVTSDLEVVKNGAAIVTQIKPTGSIFQPI
jgi:alkylation response protein AidB-like acyl-CoA dehydrogenase